MRPAAIRKTARQVFQELRKIIEVLGTRALRFAGESRHALRNVSLEADALLLAVISDVDTGALLFFDHVADGARGLVIELRLVNGFACLALE